MPSLTPAERPKSSAQRMKGIGEIAVTRQLAECLPVRQNLGADFGTHEWGAGYEGRRAPLFQTPNDIEGYIFPNASHRPDRHTIDEYIGIRLLFFQR